jgi:hypothetical protein
LPDKIEYVHDLSYVFPSRQNRRRGLPCVNPHAQAFPGIDFHTRPAAPVQYLEKWMNRNIF